MDGHRPGEHAGPATDGGGGAVASLTVRSVRSRSCAVDGWLTLSAGRRAADLPGPCREPAQIGADGTVPRWEDYVAAAATDSYGARPGVLGSSLVDAVSCVSAIGPGAAIGASEEGGHVTSYSRDLRGARPCPVTLVDGGTLPVDPAARTAALGVLDDLVGAILGEADATTRVVVAGVGDGLSSVRPRAALVTGPTPGVLTSPSTRQPGLIQLQDLTASLLEWTGAADAGLTGRPVTVQDDNRSATKRIEDLQGFEVRAATLRSVSPRSRAGLLRRSPSGVWQWSWLCGGAAGSVAAWPSPVWPWRPCPSRPSWRTSCPGGGARHLPSHSSRC